MSREVMQKVLSSLINLQPIIGNGLLDERQLAFIDPYLDVAAMILIEELAKPEPVAVAKVLFRQDIDGLEPINFYGPGTAPDPSTIKDRFTLRDVWLSPPQRQPLTAAMVQESKMLDDYNERGIFIDGWLKAEAAHGIKE